MVTSLQFPIYDIFSGENFTPSQLTIKFISSSRNASVLAVLGASFSIQYFPNLITEFSSSYFTWYGVMKVESFSVV
jgi:hypothetical protein